MKKPYMLAVAKSETLDLHEDSVGAGRGDKMFDGNTFRMRRLLLLLSLLLLL